MTARRRAWRGRAFVARLAALLAVACASATPPSGVVPAAPPAPPWLSPVLADHPLVGRIVDGHSGLALTPEAVIARLAAARFVLLGEKHDNADHHRLQAWVISRLVAEGRHPAVVMEMLDEDQADALARHLRDHPDDAAGLGDAVGWGQSGWPPWPLYQPIAEAALPARLPLIPGSLARATLRRVAADDPDLGARTLRTTLGLDATLAPAVRDAMAREIDRGHCGMAPKPSLPRMIEAQRARDAALARALATSLEETAVLVAGTGHTRADLGVPLHLPSHVAVASVAFVEVSETLRDPLDALHGADGVGPHDVVWLTPRTDAKDACEAYRESLEKMRRGP